MLLDVYALRNIQALVNNVAQDKFTVSWIYVHLIIKFPCA